jgi:hypothetical protein
MSLPPMREVVHSSSFLVRWGGLALIVGGLLWIASYGTGLVNGRTIDPHIQNLSPLEWISGITFSGAFLFLGIGLAALGARLQQRSKPLALVGTLLAFLPITAGLVNLVLLTGLFRGIRVIGLLAGIGVVCTFASATLLGIATLHTRSLPRWTALILLVTGLVTFPVILLTIPLSAFVPDYITGDLPFALSAALFLVVGSQMLRAWHEPSEQVM